MFGNNLLLDVLPPRLAANLAQTILVALGLPVVLALGVLVRVLEVGILADLGVGRLVHLLETVGYSPRQRKGYIQQGERNPTFDAIIQVLLELRLVPLLIVVGKRLHILSDMSTKDILPQHLRLELLRLDIEAREPALRVGDEDATVRRALHRTKHPRAGGGPLQADIENGLERAAVVLAVLGDLVLAVGFRDALERVAEAELGEGATCEEEPGSVGSSPVGEAVLDAVAGELVGVGGGEDLVTDDLRGHDLRDDLRDSC